MAARNLTDHLVDPLRPKESLILGNNEREWVNEKSQRRFSCLGNIPFLFRQPEASFLEWQARTANFFTELNQELLSLQQQLSRSDLLSLTKKRLQILREGKLAYRDQCAKILAPLALQADQVNDLLVKMQAHLPGQQRLLGYGQNLFRDWCWGDKENNLSMDVIREVIPHDDQLGVLLIEGAGACRLAVDIHNHWHPELTIATDINPFLLLSAEKIIFHQGFTLPEFAFPVAKLDDVSVPRELRYLGKDIDPETFKMVLCDGMHPPFAAESFDTILTPWFIDIIYEDIRNFIPGLGRLLKQGGRWIHFGPLLFDQCQPSQRYGLEEVLQVAQDSGFAIQAQTSRLIPYLQSPAASHQRYETVYAFVAEKKQTVTSQDWQGSDYLPDWLQTPSRPIPNTTFLQQYAQSQKMIEMILSQVNGKRSINDLSFWAAKSFKGDQSVFKKILLDFFTDFYERYKKSLFQGTR